jgi:SAM-dependent methyltransferase
MRDTDADWTAISAREPHFGVLTNERYLAANLTAEAVEDFYSTGTGDVAVIVEELRRRWPDFSPTAAIDFGCGVGRLSLAMLAHAAEVVGVDVAPAMLLRATERAKKVGAHLTFTDQIPDSADWVMSHIVFQHIPPARGLKLLEKLLATLPVGGFASLQFTIHRAATRLGGLDARWVRFDGEEINLLVEDADPTPGMRMFDYDAGAIIARYFDAGLVDPVLLRTDHGGHIGAWFLGRRHV